MPISRRLDELDAAVALALVPRDEDMQRRVEAERRGRRGNIVHVAVGDQDRPADPLRRRVRERRRAARQTAACRRFPIRSRGVSTTLTSTLPSAASRVFERGSRLVCLARPFADAAGFRICRGPPRRCLSAAGGSPARGSDRQAPASSSAQVRAPAATRRVRRARTRRANAASASDRQPERMRQRQQRRKGDRPYAQCDEPLQHVLGVDLVGFVIAGQRVHHEIDAAAQRHLALARRRRESADRAAALGVARPGARRDRSR